MMKEVERCGTDKYIPSKTVREFSQHFRGKEKANLSKASRWYKNRTAIIAQDDDEVMCVSHFGKGGDLRKATPRQEGKTSW